MVDERQNFNSGCKFWGWQSEMGTKGEVNWGKSVYSDDLLIIYKKTLGKYTISVYPSSFGTEMI